MIVMLILSWKVGSVELSWSQFFQEILKRIVVGIDSNPTLESIILWDLRLPRIILALGVGAALSLAGTGYQAVLGNSLADPYLLGVSAGASFGAVLVISLMRLGSIFLPLAAFSASIVTVIVVLALARSTDGSYPPDRLILSGVALSAILTAVISALLLYSREQLAHAFAWLLGGFSGRGWREVKMFLPYAVLGGAGLLLIPREMNLIALGEQAASNLGLSTRRFKLWVLLIGTLLAASAVSVSGVIGFVGLIVPHSARMLVGPDHRGLLPVAMLGGAVLLLGADTLSRVIGMELPVGIVTALMGGPFFLWMLRKRRYGG